MFICPCKNKKMADDGSARYLLLLTQKEIISLRGCKRFYIKIIIHAAPPPMTNYFYDDVFSTMKKKQQQK